MRSNLKNVSGGLNLSRGSNMVGFTSLNWNRFLADLRRGSNSLNSASGLEQ